MLVELRFVLVRFQRGRPCAASEIKDSSPQIPEESGAHRERCVCKEICGNNPVSSQCELIPEEQRRPRVQTLVHANLLGIRFARSFIQRCDETIVPLFVNLFPSSHSTENGSVICSSAWLDMIRSHIRPQGRSAMLSTATIREFASACCRSDVDPQRSFAGRFSNVNPPTTPIQNRIRRIRIAIKPPPICDCAPNSRVILPSKVS